MLHLILVDRLSEKFAVFSLGETGFGEVTDASVHSAG